MKFVLLCLITGVAYGGTWYSKTFTKNNGSHFYVGVSNQHRDLKKAMDEAYMNAVSEAIRHNYGFYQKFSSNYFSTTNKVEINESSEVSHEQIKLNNITPVREYISEKDDLYTVYRQIEYPIAAIHAEQKRLKTLMNPIEHTYGSQKAGLGSIVIKSRPHNSMVYLTKKDGSFQLEGTTNAKVHLPLGEYDMTLVKEGHYEVVKEIIVSGEKGEYTFELKPILAPVSFDIQPSDASVYVNNRKVDGSVKLKGNQIYTVRLEHPNYFNESFQIAPYMDESLKVYKYMQPKPGYLTVISKQAGTTVLVDDKVIGHEKVKQYKLPAGMHKLVVRKPGFESAEQEVEVKANFHHKPIMVQLEKKKPESKLSKFIFSREKKSYKLEKFSVMYLPSYSAESYDRFFLLPFKLEFYGNYLSYGIGYFYDEEDITDEMELEGYDGSAYSLNRSHFNFDIKFNIRTRFLTLGLGGGYYWKRASIKEGAYETLESFKDDGIATVASLKIHLGRKRSFSLYIEGSQYRVDNAESIYDGQVLENYRAGLSWDY